MKDIEQIKTVMNMWVKDIVPFVQRGGLGDRITETGVSIYFNIRELWSVDVRYNVLKKEFIITFPFDFDEQSLDFKTSAQFLVYKVMEILQKTKDAYSGCGKKTEMYFLYSLLKESD